MTTNEDAPFGVFRLGYSLFVWGNVALLTVIMVWVFWTMFMNTPSGTLATERFEAALPTREVVAEEALTRMDPNACKKSPVTVCTACHLIDGAGTEVCPSLLEIATVAEARIADPGYSGSASTAMDYLRESVLNPSVYVVDSPEGKVYGSPGASVMPEGLEDQVDLEAVLEYIYCAGGGKELRAAAAEGGAGSAEDGEDAGEAEDENEGDASEDEAADEEDGSDADEDEAADEGDDAAGGDDGAGDDA